MKWLFGLLLLANVGLLMWGAWYRQPLVPIAALSPPPDVAPQKLKLLSEPGVRLSIRPKNLPAVADSAPLQCYRLGPFRSLERARMATEKLDAWNLPYERQSELETLGLAYRLTLPGFATKEEADARRRELTRLGFTDHALLTDEEGRGYAVSLGIFGIEQNAQTRQKQLAAKGIDASILGVPKMRATTWLVLSSAPGTDAIGEIPLARFAAEDWGGSEITFEPMACYADASQTGAETPASTGR